ncbi:MAG: hypothetical protein EBR82_04040 [Caulobacteraceae bacterium]|nr:hypothetical protein [Caulobacteraceae bacterium]
MRLSIKTVCTLYAVGVFPAFFLTTYLAGSVGPWALLLLLAYALVAVFVLKCPRCGLLTSSRVWRSRGKERKSPITHAPNPDVCSRCGLDFRDHSFSDKFD